MIWKASRLLIAAIIVCLTIVSQAILAGDGLMLLSMDEAKELRLEDEEWEKGGMPKALGYGIGPKIVFESPKVKETDKGLVIDSPSTMDLLVFFREGIAPVNMKSLNIKAKKGWFSKNLTKRLEPYLLGQSIRANNVKIPSGRFKLEIKVADDDGNESVQEYMCEIRDK
ncbi:hypothetical protein [Pseudodesulfovibrio sp. zrk46]|uniref:hypothetical protein n=1 Tax=Pseudodesulfovibrio sp. zrk46 TaxID=2725288 RepID=UPI001449378A|nr:hypothetical protein [Pseudodesulfovibrio sp. zrk46]QJB57055.1 hypothetical protein HFN16_11875 [Pseudodesulfovibrio sp. zrk46]